MLLKTVRSILQKPVAWSASMTRHGPGCRASAAGYGVLVSVMIMPEFTHPRSFRATHLPRPSASTRSMLYSTLCPQTSTSAHSHGGLLCLWFLGGFSRGSARILERGRRDMQGIYSLQSQMMVTGPCRQPCLPAFLSQVEIATSHIVPSALGAQQRCPYLLGPHD